ncbi:c-type cytochrome [Consotaella salsifontis]|uniref:Cytochrome c n=1 Tax=Consotaella salsifontis TaxID=1365950 RepID=A0A1T4NMG7_9HYPH|nr:cytochrome c family protein [Consotaella salsifontis]SJZ80459.1 cytochrome c [Consotaella salsifontis]
MRVKSILAGAAVATLVCLPALAQTVGDPAAGKKVFSKCMACHRIGPNAKNLVGPELNGIVGEEVAAVEGYPFSKDFAAWGQGKTWNTQLLTEWVRSPKDVVPKTKMVFAGIKKDEDITNLIAYLASFDEDGKEADPAARIAAADGK